MILSFSKFQSLCLPACVIIVILISLFSQVINNRGFKQSRAVYVYPRILCVNMGGYKSFDNTVGCLMLSIETRQTLIAPRDTLQNASLFVLRAHGTNKEKCHILFLSQFLLWSRGIKLERSSVKLFAATKLMLRLLTELANPLELDLNVIMQIIIANICFCDDWVGPLGSMIKAKLLIGISLAWTGTDTKSIDVYNL